MSSEWQDTLTPAIEELRRRVAAGEHMVKIGLPDNPAKAHDGTDSDLTLGEVARINEFGSNDGRIPERPAFRMGIVHGMKHFNRLNKRNLLLVAEGKKPLQQALQELGLMGAARVKIEIRQGDFEPNAPSTIAKKGSSRPLIDTAQMRQSVTFEVVK